MGRQSVYTDLKSSLVSISRLQDGEILYVEDTEDLASMHTGGSLKTYLGEEIFNNLKNAIADREEIKDSSLLFNFPFGQQKIKCDWKLVEFEAEHCLQGTIKAIAPTPKTDLNVFDSNDEDQRFYRWLSTVGEPQSVRVEIIGDLIKVTCTNKLVGSALWRSKPILKLGQDKLKYLQIWVGGRMYLPARLPPKLDSAINTKSNTMPILNLEHFRSTWVRRNQAEFFGEKGHAFVYSGDSDRGHECLAAKFDMSEKQLNKPVRELIGNPLRTVDPTVWGPREAAIKAVLQEGGYKNFDYEHRWDGLIFGFTGKAIALPDNEVLVIVKGEDWMDGYWKSRLRAEAEQGNNG